MPVDLADLDVATPYDIVVIGAGGAGMSAALYAAIAGARVLLVERTEYVGGTTAYSGGTTWIPGTRHAAAVNPDDSIANARSYLEHAVGARADPSLREAFLAHGAEAVRVIEDNSHVQYRPRPLHPDYQSELPGSTLCGRALEPLPFDGRALGALFALVRPPIPEFTVLSRMMVDRDDIVALLGFPRSLASIRHVARILARHAVDRLRHPRGTRLVMGNALIARLLLSLAERRVPMLMRTALTALRRDASGITAVTLSANGIDRVVPVRGGVILASGGFNRHPQRRARWLPGIAPAWCPGAPGHTGAAHDIAQGIGAAYGEGALSPCFWAPVSIRRREDGSDAAFPHFVFDRAKPGTVVVDGTGRRFVNEAISYHLFALAMQANPRAVPAFLVTDAEGLRKYGLGMVRPGGKGRERYLADGYLVSAETPAALAAKLGIDAAALESTIAQMNEASRSGVDAPFARGTTAYQRANGDATHAGPNPTLGAIATPPYYAVRLYPGDIGAAMGLRTDAEARVQDAGGAPIAGLYACGNDMHSIMGGTYPGPGITLGPALVFAYIAARDALARARRGAPSESVRRAARTA